MTNHACYRAGTNDQGCGCPQLPCGPEPGLRRRTVGKGKVVSNHLQQLSRYWSGKEAATGKRISDAEDYATHGKRNGDEDKETSIGILKLCTYLKRKDISERKKYK